MPAFVSPDNVQVSPLQSQVVTSGATVSIPTAGALPTGRRIRSVIFRMDVDLTQPGAAQAAQLGSVLHQLIAQVKIGRRVSITGLGMFFLNWLIRGKTPACPPGFPATAAGVFSRSIVWQLDYSDESAFSYNDCAVPSELWTDPIEVRFGTNGIFAATAPTIGNGVLRTFVVHDAAGTSKDGKRVTVPPSLNIQSDDFNALQATINKPGAWAYAVLYREASNDAGAITSTQVSNVLASVDGIPVVNNLRLQDLASYFNSIRAEGSNFRNDTNNGVAGTLPIPGAATNTAPPAFSGEAIMDQPGSATAAGQGVTCDVLPILFPPWPYDVSMLPRARIGFTNSAAGTLGAYKIAYRIHERRPEGAIGNAARRLGVTKGIYGAKLGGPGDLSSDPELAPFLPAVVQE